MNAHNAIITSFFIVFSYFSCYPLKNLESEGGTLCAKKETYTIDYIYALPEGQRAELIDGVVYDMAPPNRIHQEIVMNFSAEIRDYIKKSWLLQSLSSSIRCIFECR